MKDTEQTYKTASFTIKSLLTQRHVIPRIRLFRSAYCNFYKDESLAKSVGTSRKEILTVAGPQVDFRYWTTQAHVGKVVERDDQEEIIPAPTLVSQLP